VADRPPWFHYRLRVTKLLPLYNSSLHLPSCSLLGRNVPTALRRLRFHKSQFCSAVRRIELMDIRIQRLISYIEEQPHRPLSLAFMARVTGLSPSRLRHKFKAEVGVTPTVYLQTLRLRKAKELLATNNHTVKEVKAAVGISSDSYFTHQFKRAFGVPPSRSRA